MIRRVASERDLRALAINGEPLRRQPHFRGRAWIPEGATANKAVAGKVAVRMSDA